MRLKHVRRDGSAVTAELDRAHWTHAAKVLIRALAVLLLQNEDQTLGLQHATQLLVLRQDIAQQIVHLVGLVRVLIVDASGVIFDGLATHHIAPMLEV
ncbi:hypothetical protein SAMD00019534_053420, partial [Acytostelium subglobosum LB1]|uniref:hypothetical protein n=1 Tax=Acytostelium subglobosum LB1 TaxID=1410327 RepID=UPI000644B1EA